MYISTYTKESMEHDICSYLHISSIELESLLQKAGKFANKEFYFDGTKFDYVINDFLDMHTPASLIDQVLFFHLTRRLNTAKNNFVGRNLMDLLTTSNALSDFLKYHDVEFSPNNGHLDLYHKGKLVSLEKTHEMNVPYLRARFGYNKGREDYCFNGFLFKDRLYKNNYARELSDVPEFIGVLATFLNRQDIGTDYYQNSTYYCFEYCVPLEKVLFDDKEELLNDEKRKYLLNQVLRRLYDYIDYNSRYGFDHDNPILRLKDFDTMEDKYFVSCEIITEDMLTW